MQPAHEEQPEVLYRQESYQIMGACFEVYKVMGNGFVEPVYQECLGIEFTLRGLIFVSNLGLNLKYKEHQLTQTYKPDFVLFDKIIVEIKAVSQLVDEHRAQILNYMKATNFRLGLLVNFGHCPKVEYERFVM